jgi:hypothetical protein
MRTALLLLVLALSAPAFAQAPAERGATPPGASSDGAAPAQGAIKGGAILPGETGGVPRAAPGMPQTEHTVSRCLDLTGVLREECLRQEAAAGAAGRTAPGPAAPPSPREAPPPQRPR